jgi:AbrB family looped-hinge helix DNA binding protein
MAFAKINSEGQITIPAEVLKNLDLKAGDYVSLIEGEDGKYSFRKACSIMDLQGCVRWTGKPVTIEEMNETNAKGWAGQLTFED